MSILRTVQIGNNGKTQVTERSLQEATQGAKPATKVALIPLQSDRTLAYREGASRTTFEVAEYDFNEILTIEDTESYFARAVDKKANLMFKEGWSILSKNEEVQEYVDKRLSQISRAQSKPWPQLLKETGRDLFRFSNAIWIKARNTQGSGGFPRQVKGANGRTKTLEPVAAYFIVPMETIEFKRNKAGRITRIKQVMGDGRSKEFPMDNVIHFYINKKNGWAVGTPGIVPVIDDIRTLRRIEENIDLLVYQNLFPLFQYKVGTVDRPAQMYPDGSSEIDHVRSEISYMPPEGVIVTPERHDIKLIGSEGRALRAEEYLKHFKIRVLAGLQMSTVDMGEGSTVNKSTATTLSAQLVDAVKSVQQDFATQFNFLILDDLLIEGRFGSLDPLVPENAAQIIFKEIDIDKKIKMQAHAADVFTKHLLMEDEARMLVGWDKLDPEDERRDLSYFKLYEEPLALLKSAEHGSPSSFAAADNSHIAMEPSNLDGASQAQQAVAPAPSPLSVSDQLSFNSRTILNDSNIKNAFKLLKNNFNSNILADQWKVIISETFDQLCVVRFRDGIQNKTNARWSLNFSSELNQLSQHTAQKLDYIAADLVTSLNKYKLADQNHLVMGIIDLGMRRVEKLYNHIGIAAHAYGEVCSLATQGITTFKFASGTKNPRLTTESLVQLTLDADTVSINQILPYCDSFDIVVSCAGDNTNE